MLKALSPGGNSGGGGRPTLIQRVRPSEGASGLSDFRAPSRLSPVRARRRRPALRHPDARLGAPAFGETSF